MWFHPKKESFRAAPQVPADEHRRKGVAPETYGGLGVAYAATYSHTRFQLDTDEGIQPGGYVQMNVRT